VNSIGPSAYAAPAGGGLPWERPMTLIATSLTGPVAYAIGLIGICIAEPRRNGVRFGQRFFWIHWLARVMKRLRTTTTSAAAP